MLQTWDETGGLDLEGKREGVIKIFRRLTCLPAPTPPRSAGVFLVIVSWCWRLGNWNELREKRLEAKIFVIHGAWGQRERGDCSRFSTTERRLRLGIGSWGERRGVDLLSVYSRRCSLGFLDGTEK